MFTNSSNQTTEQELYGKLPDVVDDIYSWINKSYQPKESKRRIMAIKRFIENLSPSEPQKDLKWVLQHLPLLVGRLEKSGTLSKSTINRDMWRAKKAIEKFLESKKSSLSEIESTPDGIFPKDCTIRDVLEWVKQSFVGSNKQNKLFSLKSFISVLQPVEFKTNLNWFWNNFDELADRLEEKKKGSASKTSLKSYRYLVHKLLIDFKDREKSFTLPKVKEDVKNKPRVFESKENDAGFILTVKGLSLEEVEKIQKTILVSSKKFMAVCIERA
jgi:hypothetical protein